MTSESQLSALERLADLRSRGMLTEDQYEVQKARVLVGASTRLPIIIVISVIVILAFVTTLFLRVRAHFSTPAPTPVSIGPTPLPLSKAPPLTPTRPVVLVRDPEVPLGHGVSSSADPIAQASFQAAGMTPETTLNVAGARVVLYKERNADLFDATYVLMVGGNSEVLEKGAIYSISKVGPYVILETDSGGTACPAEFRIVDVTGGRITRSFGTCSDLIRTHETSDGSLISIVHSFGAGGPVTAKYSSGILTVWGEH